MPAPQFCRALTAALFAAICMVPVAAQAQAEPSMEERLQTLEALVEGLVEGLVDRLDAQTAMVMTETAAMRDQQAELSAQVGTAAQLQQRDGFSLSLQV